MFDVHLCVDGSEVAVGSGTVRVLGIPGNTTVALCEDPSVTVALAFSGWATGQWAECVCGLRSRSVICVPPCFGESPPERESCAADCAPLIARARVDWGAIAAETGVPVATADLATLPPADRDAVKTFAQGVARAFEMIVVRVAGFCVTSEAPESVGHTVAIEPTASTAIAVRFACGADGTEDGIVFFFSLYVYYHMSPY